ncbi:hypothetical protein JW926_10790, partial [Candidatus Sumerlaeota bacterium]|nr:hypothetical protein [Candidatus Sumerlaeota bacterium]
QLIIRGRAQCVSPEGKKPYVITQNPDRFFFESTLLQEMTAPVFFRESDLKKRGDAEKEALSILDTFGLSEKKDLSPPRISFGERLRLAAAQAAFLKPDFILVDDVLAFLGEKERGSFIQVLRRIKQERRCGLLFTTSQEIPSLMQGQRVARLDDAPCAKAENKGSGERPIISLEKQLRKTAPRRKGKRGILRFFRRKPFEYVPSNTLVHRIPAWIKLAINIGLWIMIMLSKPRRYPYVAALGLLYYLGGGLGFKRLFADTKYFILQAIFFCVVIMLFRWDAGAWRTGLLYGVRVWLIFLPMAVMMRATTTDEWTALFGKVLSAPKRIVLGISLGLLPVIVSELGEVLFVQRQKGFVLKKGDVFHPRRFWRYMKSLLVPVVIMTEDLARLAEISVILDDRKSRYFTKGEFDEE